MRYILLFNASQVPGGINWLLIVFNLLTKGFSFVEARRHKVLQSKRAHQKAFFATHFKESSRHSVRDEKPFKKNMSHELRKLMVFSMIVLFFQLLV